MNAFERKVKTESTNDKSVVQVLPKNFEVRTKLVLAAVVLLAPLQVKIQKKIQA